MRPVRLPVLFALFWFILSAGLSQAQETPVRQVLPQAMPRPVQVHLIVRILDVLKIDETAGEAQIAVEVQQRWQDPTLGFNAVTIGRDRQDLAGREASERLAAIWSPAIIIENQIGAQRPELEALSIRADGTVTLTRRIVSNFRFANDLSAFPFDQQRLVLSFVSQYYPSDDVVFVQDYQDRQLSTLPASLKASDWSARSLGFSSDQFYGWSARPFARLTAEMAIDRKWPRYVLRIFVPFMAVLSVSLFVLWAPEGLMGDKTGITYSALLALAALSFTFERSFPGSMSVTSPIAFMISIGYFYLILALLMDFLLKGKSLPGRLTYPHLAHEIRVAVRYLMPFLFITICLCVTLRSLA